MTSVYSVGLSYATLKTSRGQVLYKEKRCVQLVILVTGGSKQHGTGLLAVSQLSRYHHRGSVDWKRSHDTWERQTVETHQSNHSLYFLITICGGGGQRMPPNTSRDQKTTSAFFHGFQKRN